jgi:hypothetical protein
LTAHAGTLEPVSRDSYADALHSLLSVKDQRYRTELMIRCAIPREKVIGSDKKLQVKAVEEALSVVEKPLAFLLAHH